MGPSWDQIRDPWVCSQTRYWLHYEAKSIKVSNILDPGQVSQVRHFVQADLGSNCL